MRQLTVPDWYSAFFRRPRLAEVAAEQGLRPGRRVKIEKRTAGKERKRDSPQ